MQTRIEGPVYVLGDNIDTDQIIPARYLVYSLEKPGEREKYGQFALSGVPLPEAGLPEGQVPFVPEGDHRSPFPIVIAGRNFGCGSSREHAPAAMQIAGVQAVVAESFARIFYRNTVDGGFLIPLECTEPLPPHFSTHDEAVIDLENSFIYNKRTQRRFAFRPLGSVEAIVRAGGIFEYARKTGMIGGTHHVQER